MPHVLTRARRADEAWNRARACTAQAQMTFRHLAKSLMSFYRSTRPNLVAIAQTLPAPDSGATLTEAFAALNS